MGKGAGSDDEAEQEADVRIDWMEARITNLGKYKPDKVLQMLASEESRNALMDFLDDEDSKGVIVHTDPKGDLKASAPSSINVTNKKKHQVGVVPENAEGQSISRRYIAACSMR
jgi:hypothetical protein